MTLDEAIKRYIDNAEYERTHGNLQGCLEFKQLVEWLRELKTYKEQDGDTINRQAAIRIASGYCHPANIANELAKLPPVQPEQRWIPVSERMPEEDCRNGENQQKSDYLLMSVHNEEDGVTIVDYGYTVDGNWYSDTTYQFIPPGWEVIAWMPLPEPYKPHESEE